MQNRHDLTLDPFELFGIEPSFSIDVLQLSNILRNLLQKVHPDRFANSSSQEQMLAMQKTAQINDAFAMLKSPIKRAQLLLKSRNGVDATKEITIKDPMFLMQQLELREELEQIIDNKSLEQLSSFQQTMESNANQYLAEIEELFAQQDTDTEAVMSNIYKLQFINKTLADLELAEEKLLD